MNNYNKDYKEKKHYFGLPYPELITFFKNYELKGSLVDLGAGQGRNSIPLSLMGYNVHAVDQSEVGLNQIKEKNKNIIIKKADIYKFDISKFDIILLDSMLHYYKREIDKENTFIKNIIKNMKEGAIIVNAMIASKSKYFLEPLKASDDFVIIMNSIIKTNWNVDYNICIVKKKNASIYF